MFDENTSEKGYVQVCSPFDQSFSGAEDLKSGFSKQKFIYMTSALPSIALRQNLLHRTAGPPLLPFFRLLSWRHCLP